MGLAGRSKDENATKKHPVKNAFVHHDALAINLPIVAEADMKIKWEPPKKWEAFQRYPATVCFSGRNGQTSLQAQHVVHVVKPGRFAHQKFCRRKRTERITVTV